MAVGSVWPTDRHHAACFYEHDEQLGDEVGTFVSRALAAGGTAIIVATPEHRVAFERHLPQTASGHAADGDRLVMIDAVEALARFMVNGWPDRAAFDASIGALVRNAGAAGGPVHVYGEMVAVLWDQGLVAAALELEAAWGHLGEQTDFSLLCGYPRAAVSGNDHPSSFDDVCRLHSMVVERAELGPTRVVTHGGLRASLAEAPESTVVTLAGTFTAAEVPGFTTAIEGGSFGSTVVFDLSNLSAISADGMECMTRLAQRLRDAVLIAWAPRPSVRRALEAAGLDGHFHVAG